MVNARYQCLDVSLVRLHCLDSLGYQGTLHDYLSNADLRTVVCADTAAGARCQGGLLP